jgi:hypothetical protein
MNMALLMKGSSNHHDIPARAKHGPVVTVQVAGLEIGCVIDGAGHMPQVKLKLVLH